MCSVHTHSHTRARVCVKGTGVHRKVDNGRLERGSGSVGFEGLSIDMGEIKTGVERGIQESQGTQCFRMSIRSRETLNWSSPLVRKEDLRERREPKEPEDQKEDDNYMRHSLRKSAKARRWSENLQ